MEDKTKKIRFSDDHQIRVRMAPSPTGFFHIGAARTTLFNYLFAKKHSGVFILRMEDTDEERSKKEYEKDIINNINGLGLHPDEGPEAGGDFGPYRQSERAEIYKKYLEKLLKEDKAYYCFCSPEELKARREYQMSIGQAPKYSGKCAALSKEKAQDLIAQGKEHVIRFRMPPQKVEFNDLVRGGIEFDVSLIGDIVIAKDTSAPLYNFACVVDDYEMKITHVIRGEDHIPNTPKQIMLQQAFGFPTPEYAHLPLILGKDGSKLSKRHGAVSVSDYKKRGYLPEALVNFMAFLGWNPGTEREIFSLNSLVKEFSLERVQNSGAVFNIKRLNFLNKFYIRQKPIEKLTELCIPYLLESGLISHLAEEKKLTPTYGDEKEARQYKVPGTGERIDFTKIQKIVSLYQERLETLSEIGELTDFFFKDKIEYEKELLRWKDMSDKDLESSIDKLERTLHKIDESTFEKDELGKILLKEAEDFAKKIDREGDRGALLWPLRAALTGKKASAGPFEIGEVLGKEKTLKRIRQAKQFLENEAK
ncbi:MAG: glutamate--tRNA ligase [Candidatus Nealsonbacteria bacterium]|nr:glutamate--tRNA ligase [Candidatus Nealsonbacteria bacterium]